VTGGAKGSCALNIDNLFVRRLGDPQPALIASNSIVSARRITLDNLDLKVTGEVTFADCLINGKPNPPDAKIPGANLEKLIKTIVPESYQSHFQKP
jgi:hypothetical protein